MVHQTGGEMNIQNRPAISVIIPAYNDIAGVLTCLNSLRAMASGGYEIEYLVQDDCSPNVLYTALVPPEIASVERNETNLGFSGNCNAASRRANGEILFFVNQDVYGVEQFSRSWDTHLLEAFSGSSKVGIVGPRLLFPDGSIQSVGGIFDGKCQPHHIGLGWSNIHHEEVNTSKVVPWLTGAAFAVRRWVWEALNGFDKSYINGYFEDVDFCCRAAEAGIDTYICTETSFVHSVGSSGGNAGYFQHNAKVFFERWVATKKVEPGVAFVYERFWT
jgi:GT2 family glycosyltransferase